MSDHNHLRTRIQRFLPLLLVLWLVALVPAARKLMAFEWTSGAIGHTPSHLNSTDSSAISHTASQTSSKATNNPALLVVAIHPLCSCTRATLKELETSAPGWKLPYHATFLIYKARPQAGTSTAAANSVSEFDWHHATYIRDAQQALNAEVVDDIGGEQAAKLGALTSGEVLLYSAPDQHGTRRLLFSGGVTAGRGMEGENRGIAALEKAVDLSISNQPEAHAPVYGCGLAALSNPSIGGNAR